MSWAGRDGTVERGMVLMIAAMLVVPSLDAIAKWLSATLSPGEVAWGRFFFQSLMLAPLIVFARRPLGAHPGLQALRGILIAVALLCFTAALQVMPLADCIAIFFVEPLALTVFSALFLGEPIGWRRLAAVGVGFAGALIVIRPSYEVFGIEAALPLATAVCFANYLVLTRRLVVDGDALALQFTASVFATLTLTVALAFGAVAEVPVLEVTWPDAGELWLLVGLGAIATVSHLVIVIAFRMAPAGVLAPFQYLEIISATALGLILFGDFPDALTWTGVVIIVASGLYVFHRERVAARGARAAA